MASNPPPPGNAPPKKPWEQAGTSSGPTPFKPPSVGSTSNVIEASGTAKPGEIVASTVRNQTANALASPVPPRPWQQTYGSGYGGYSYNGNYNIGYGGYGSGLYGNGMYPSYGGMYNNGFGGSSGVYGMGFGGPYGSQDPNNPNGPPSPPGFWISLLRVMQGVVNCFGRVAILIDQNTQALHMFMSALLQLFDRSGLLYNELARFVLRILTKRKKRVQPGPADHGQQILEGPKGNTGSWDSLWGDDTKGKLANN